MPGLRSDQVQREMVGARHREQSACLAFMTILAQAKQVTMWLQGGGWHGRADEDFKGELCRHVHPLLHESVASC